MISFVLFNNEELYQIYSDIAPRDYSNNIIIKLNNNYIKLFTKSADITIKQIGIALQKFLNKRNICSFYECN